MRGDEVTSYRDFPGEVPRTGAAFLLMFIRRRFFWNVVALALTGVTSMGLMGMEPMALRNLVRALDQAGGGGWTVDAALWTGLLGFFWLGSSLGNRATEWVELRTGPRLKAAVQSYLFSYLMEHAPGYFQDNFSGRLAQKLRDAPTACWVLIYIAGHDLVRVFVIITIGLVSLAAEHWAFAVAILGWTAVYMCGSAWFAGRCIALSRNAADSASLVGGRVVDTISNAELVRAFGTLVRERRVLAEVLRGERLAAERLRLFLIYLRALMFSTTILFQVVLILMAVDRAVAGHMTTGDVMMVTSLSALVGMNVYNLGARLFDWFEQLGTLSEAIVLLTQPHQIVEASNAAALVVGRGAVTFEDVRFSHGDGTRLFDGLNVDIEPGEKVALVGPSGAGKSTLVRLLLRHNDLQAGRITVDGRDIATVTLASLHAAIAEVPQAPALFHRSIRENLIYGCPEIGEAAMLEAAEQAHCMEFIERRDEGFDAVVGERGVRLSGGERQRVAIARAFLKNAPILVLDEATSALDSETEHLIQESLWRLMEGRTVIAIAHRLSTIRQSDRVLYMDRGRILEQGSHQQLLDLGGHYARLWARQSGGFLPAA